MVTGSLKSTRPALRRNDLLRMTRGFFLICLRSCFVIAAFCFLEIFFADAEPANAPKTIATAVASATTRSTRLLRDTFSSLMVGPFPPAVAQNSGIWPRAASSERMNFPLQARHGD